MTINVVKPSLKFGDDGKAAAASAHQVLEHRQKEEKYDPTAKGEKGAPAKFDLTQSHSAERPEW